MCTVGDISNSSLYSLERSRDGAVDEVGIGLWHQHGRRSCIDSCQDSCGGNKGVADLHPAQWNLYHVYQEHETACARMNIEVFSHSTWARAH